MKTKTLAALALIAALGASPAWAAEVVSSNIVGYTKVNVVSGLNMISGAFVAVGGENADINASVVSSDLPAATMAKFWDATTKSYSTLIYYPDPDDGIYEDDSYENNLGAGWGDSDAIVVDKEMVPGTGFWVQSPSAATITLCGEVSTNSVDVSLVAGLNFVGNPFPGQIDISAITSSDLPAATMAKFWDATSKTYSTLIYYPDPDDGIYEDDSYENNLGAGWGDSDAIAVDFPLDAGTGFWIQSPSAATITISY